MHLATEDYVSQAKSWPQRGRHVLAQYDDDTIVVYQAYKPTIADFAVKHGYFGGEWNAGRMTWIKTGFLWMMYRSGWATKEDQEVVLAITLRRAGFDNILNNAIESRFEPNVFATHDEWAHAVETSDVRLQWDPDHDPAGGKVDRRAIQLGLRGCASRRFSREWIVRIDDITAFVVEQRSHSAPKHWKHLVTPQERVYPIAHPEVARRLGVTPAPDVTVQR